MDLCMLTALECSKALQKKGESMKEVSFYDEVNAGPSGGTLATVFHVLSNRYEARLSPFLLLF